MLTPRLEIDLGKIAHNASSMKELYGARGIDVIGVTKGISGDPHIAKTLVDSGISILGDSRLENFNRMHEAGIQAEFLLLRTPLLSQCESVVKCTDISFNSEISVIRALSRYALEQNTTHKIILMMEMGDLREGIMPSEIDQVVDRVLELKGVELVGIATNLGCYGGIKPDNEKMGTLSAMASDIEVKYGLSLRFVSGGNSATYRWFMAAGDIGRINNVRLGENILLGTEATERKHIPGLYTDVFTFVAEVIESKTKPSLPYGEVGQAAFGNIPEFVDRGQMERAILGTGVQDVPVSGLSPRLDIEILGASSDHTIVNSKKVELKVGNEVEFDVDYGVLLSAMTSSYVQKAYK